MSGDETVFEVNPKQSQILSDSIDRLTALNLLSTECKNALEQVSERLLRCADVGLIANTEQKVGHEDRGRDGPKGDPTESTIDDLPNYTSFTRLSDDEKETLQDLAKFDDFGESVSRHIEELERVGKGEGQAVILDNAIDQIPEQLVEEINSKAPNAAAKLVKEFRVAGDNEPKKNQFPVRRVSEYQAPNDNDGLDDEDESVAVAKPLEEDAEHETSTSAKKDTPIDTVTFELRAPTDESAVQWSDSATSSREWDWPVIYPYVGDDDEDEASDEEEADRKVALWTVDDGVFRKIKKTNLMKRAWDGSRLEFMVYAALYRAIHQSKALETTFAGVSKIVGDKKRDCERQISDTKIALTRAKEKDKVKSEERKKAAKRIIEELKTSLKDKSLAELGSAFDDKIALSAKETLANSPHGGIFLTWKEKLSQDEWKSPNSDKELLTKGGGFGLSSKAIADILTQFEEDADDRFGKIYANMEEVKGSVAQLTETSGSSNEFLPPSDFVDFSKTIDESKNSLRKTLEDIRIDKGPQNPLHSAWNIVNKTVSKMKGIPLALASVLAVLTPILVTWGPYKEKEPLDAIKAAFLEGDTAHLVAALSATAIIVFLFLGIWDKRQEKYKAIKKARDTAQKAYEKEMKSVIGKGYAQYNKELSSALAEWKKNPADLARQLYGQKEVIDNDSPAALQEKIKLIGVAKKNLEIAEKACESERKKWSSAVNGIGKVAKRCNVFQ